MGKPYVVEFIFRTVVLGDTEADACDNALSAFREIARDVEPVAGVDHEVRVREDLPDGWDFDCIPYGGDGNTRLRDIVINATGSTA